jgi:disulfide bond formation protein DsbB
MRGLPLLTYLFNAASLAAIAAILTAAMGFQYLRGEIPCPLCLLERLALFGAGFGLIANLRGPYSTRFTGVTLGFALLLLVIAARQTLLDIYPRPGHAYVGQAVLGLHMPVWSVLIALALIAATAAKLTALGGDAHMQGARPSDAPSLDRVARALAAYLFVLCVVNFGSVVVQCGLGQCHTTGYALLP